jgi:hypothetical protein
MFKSRSATMLWATSAMLKIVGGGALGYLAVANQQEASS